jgi:hypothetical protein
MGGGGAGLARLRTIRVLIYYNVSLVHEGALRNLANALAA